MIIVILIVRKKKLYDLYNNIILNKFVNGNKYKNSTIFTIYRYGQVYY